MALSAQDVATLSRLLDDASALPAEARETWMASLMPPDDRLRSALADMLTWRDDSGFAGWLNTPPAIDCAPRCRVGAPAEVGPYLLLRELGNGGMASVWLARRAGADDGRRFAVKFPHRGHAIADLSHRLARERAILSTLHHAGIVPLVDATVDHDGYPCLVLEYVDGEHIDQFCRSRRLGLHERLQLFIQAAEAVAHAHCCQVVHRDLKPANILVSSDARVHLLDFGIAAILRQETLQPMTLTMSGGRPLTPDYASPEQLRGEAVGPASDIYSLGVVLYELLCERRPHRPKTEGLHAFIQSIVAAVPTLPSRSVDDPALSRALEGALDAILMKALRKSALDRFTSVDEMLLDLRRFLSGRAVESIDAMVGCSQTARLADPVSRELAQRGILRRFARGDTLVREGDPGTELYVLLAGRCEAVGRSPTGSRPASGRWRWASVSANCRWTAGSGTPRSSRSRRPSARRSATEPWPRPWPTIPSLQRS